MNNSYWQGVLHGMTFDGVPYQIALSSNEPFASGGSADIYKGTLLGSDPLVVAVKFFPVLGKIPKNVREQLLNRELQAAGRVSMHHESILAFLGTAYIGLQEGIVSLYMQNGNLVHYLKANPGSDKKNLILQVADAVNYLHSVGKLVHGDLKCENVLVSDSGNALLADLGLSRFLDQASSVQPTATGIRRMYTVRFAAPELLGSEEEDRDKPPSKTCASDVYAFGMLVLEAVTEEPPWSGIFPRNTRREIVEMGIITRVLDKKHPPQPRSSSGFVSISHPWWDVCTDCWKSEPNERPDMRTILDALTNTDLDPHRRLEGHSNIFWFAVYYPDGRRVVSGSEDGSIRVWDTRTGRLVIGPFLGHSMPVWCVTVSPDGRQICSGGEDRTIRRWDSASGAPIGSPMSGHDDGVVDVAFSPDSRRIVSCSFDTMVRLWDATTGEALGLPLAGHIDKVWSVAFSPDGARIASGTIDGTVCLWDSLTGANIAILLHNRREQVLSVCFSPDRIHLVSGCSDGIVRIWNVSTLQLERTLRGHSGRVRPVTFSPSGAYIASGSYDNTIRIWDAHTGDAVGVPLVGHTGHVYAVPFSPDGRSVMSCSSDGTARIWDLFTREAGH